MATALKQLINRGPAYVQRMSSGVPFVGQNLGASMESQLRATGAVGTLYAIVNALSEAVAEVEWGLYKKDSDEKIEDHPAAQTWAMPNKFMTQTEFTQMFQQHAELAGEGDWFVGRIPGHRIQIPVELWPVRPDRVQPLADPDAYLVGWRYRNGAIVQDWKPNEVIQVKLDPNPLDPYRGMSPVQSILGDVYGEQAASAYSRAFFQNSAEPGGIIQVDRRLSDEEFTEMTDRWRESHQGVSNAHRVAILERAEWVTGKYTLREMQFEALRKMNREFIREGFRFPKAMLGSTEDVNKANAQAAAWQFKDWLVQPRVQKIRDVLNHRFLPMYGRFGEGVEFRFGKDGSNQLLEDDRELQITKMEADARTVQIYVKTGFDPEDVLDLVGIPQMEYVGTTAPGTPDAPGPQDDPAPAPDDDDEPDDDDDDEPPAAQNRVGHPALLDDPAARQRYNQGMSIRARIPGITNDQLAARLGITDRTWRKYRQVFGGESE